MKRVSGILFLFAFAISGVFFSCSNNEENPAGSSNSGGSDHSSNSNNTIISSSSNNSAGNYSSSVTDSNPSSSSPANSSSAAAYSSSAATTPSSSSPAGTSSAVVASSSSRAVSSSAVAQSPCVKPMEKPEVPPGGIKSCIIVNGKCYTCNPDRGNDCNQGWIWQGGNASGDTYWYKEVDCNGSITPGASSSSKASSSSATGGGGTSSSTGNSGTPSYTPTAPGNETSKLTHYWDACKPSCSWSGKGGLQANSCNINGGKIGHNDTDKSACDNGTAFMCMNNAPWKVGNVSFGYVAAAVGSCGDCYQFDFPNGQVMVVMANNHGNIHEGAKFDLMVPGGGVGDFDAFTRQIQQVGGVSNPNMGERYGGFRGACGWEYSASAANCVKNKCEEVFKNMPELKAGCLWYVSTLGTDNASWNNPTVKYKKVTCPKELTDRY